jgi:hypothetical protein
MNKKKMRETEKVRANPDDKGKLLFLTRNKRLIAKKTKEAKESRAVAIGLRVFGGLLMAGAVSSWYSKYRVIPMTGFALISGILLAGIFKMVYPNGLDTSNKIQKNIALFVIIIPMVLIINPATAAYSIMFLYGLVPAVYLFGVLKTLPSLKP